ncbi:4a-hydroxytetrahydrobiopterin dehydratase [Embleya sp. NBC_00896]|uniref:4a-hydroxytetrahydrobiopterin dehydratase n=1 Tax=Embleya sp. NBC_00896 TaxID=2975961 RepID=UPI00386E55C0|nr:4a-hydroxytetrahydrobiopterin dehydratase [Embleya sp. NBC_00896]
MASQPLTDAELTKALADLPGWQVADGDLAATYKSPRPNVVAFYTAVAAAEDAADHHARITILYGTLSFALNTHDAGGAITAKDVDMAERITALAAEHGATVQP